MPAGGDADDRADQHGEPAGEDADQQRDARAVGDADQHVTPQPVGAEPEFAAGSDRDARRREPGLGELRGRRVTGQLREQRCGERDREGEEDGDCRGDRGAIMTQPFEGELPRAAAANGRGGAHWVTPGAARVDIVSPSASGK